MVKLPSRFVGWASWIAMVVIVLELLARYWLELGDPILYVTHPTIEYLLKADQVARPYGNLVEVNHFGMRSPDFAPNKAAGEYRVLVFGVSVVNGGNRTDQADLATALLGSRLEAERPGSVTVGNVAAGSWGPGNWLAYVQEFGFFHADAVLLVVSGHDLRDNPTFADLNSATHPEHRPVSAVWDGVWRVIVHSWLSLVAESGDSKERASRVSLAMGQGAQELSEFLQLAASQVPQVVVVLHPERRELERSQKSPELARIQRLLNQLGIPFLWGSTCLGGAEAAGLSPYRDDIHLTAAGQAALAECLLDALSLPANPGRRVAH